MTNESADSGDSGIDRRTVLRSALASGAGLVGASAFGGTAAARGGPPGNGGGGPPDGNGGGPPDGNGGGPPDDGGGQPCHKEFSCSDSEGTTYVKYELVEGEDGTCYFEEETDTGIYADITITETKDGDSCEPLAVEWDNSDYVTETLEAFGGRDCDTVVSPDGMYNADPDGDAGLDNPGGNTAAISNLQFCVEPADTPDPLECPAGTRPLARYEYTDGSFQFVDGEDVVTFTNITDSDGLKAFDFESSDGEDSNDAVETLTTVTVRCGSDVTTFEVDPDYDQDKQSGSVDLTDSGCGITDVLFCQAVYAQADFVKGDVIDSFCDSEGNNTDNYGSRKISSVTWSSYSGQLDGTQGQFDGEWIFNGDTITVDYNPTPEKDSDYDGEVSLAVYRVDDPVFQDNNNIEYSATKCRQTRYSQDYESSSNTAGTLTADLPEP